MLPLARLLPLLALLSAGSVAAKEKTSGFHMKPVRSIQARVQGDAPVWDEEHQAFVSSFGETFDEQYRASLDSVNTASVEGALMYVQAEGINQYEQSVQCERKNKMQYVVFYDIVVHQTNNALAKYSQPSQALPEYCPFAALDSGMCTPEAPNKLPIACEQLLGLNGQPNLGPCVGGETRHTDVRAPYPDTVWFSFPNSCVTKSWADKTDKCRAKVPGGLCRFGMEPDGVSCTYAYAIVGYVSIDDVVGITRIPTKSDPSVTYKNFTEFCMDGNVEFKAKNNMVEQSLPFWNDPYNPETNAKRARRLVKTYNKRLQEHMRPLPTVKELAEANPPCYENTPICATAQFGCRRKLFSQICEVCSQPDSDCVAAPEGFTFPPLSIDKRFGMTPAQPRSGETTTGTETSDASHEQEQVEVPDKKARVKKAQNADGSATDESEDSDASASAATGPEVEPPTATKKQSHDFSELDENKNATSNPEPTTKAPLNGTATTMDGKSAASTVSMVSSVLVIAVSTIVATWM